MQSSADGWQPGMQVRLIHNPVRIGTLTDAEPLLRNGQRLFQVRFPGSVERIYDDQLEPLPEERMQPLDLLEKGKLGDPKDLRRTLTHVRMTGRLADIIYSMEATNTDFYPYQFKPVLKLLQAPANALLIGDEVGLGKTIEAGLIWTELRSRFDLKRMVVLCPAALREKWYDELRDKMGLDPKIYDAQETLECLRDRRAHSRGFVIISSLQGLRPPRRWEDPEERTSAAAELARFLRDKESDERLVDLLVVDEAHHLRNPKSQTNSLGRLLRGVSEYLVLLTATPIHNRNRDLFSLLHLLDPDNFSRPEDFEEILNANAPLVRARDAVLEGTTTAADLEAMLTEATSHPLLRGNRQLESLLSEIAGGAVASHAARDRIARRLETVNLLGHAVTRTRKRDVNELRAVREPKAEFVPMTNAERRFYEAVTGIVADYARKRAASEAFLLATPQRQVASCMAAALRSWKDRGVEIPEDELSGTEEDKRKRNRLGPLTTELVRRADEFGDLKELTDNDSKYTRLRKVLADLFEDRSESKVIVFSTFRGTLAYLKDRLRQDGISCIVLQGGESKHEIIQEFRSSKEINVLLSSEVGGEGVDLQFSSIVINYDLPWNPMRVEQRIGRVDRLGQESDKILVWNLFYDDTIGSRIYERLYDKLDLCRNALGDFEAVLGDEIGTLTRELLLGGLTPEQQEERIAQTAQALETMKREQEALEAEAAHLVAYGDYIYRQIHAAHDMNRWITGEDIFNYVFDFIDAHYPGYEREKASDDKFEYRLSLSAQARYDLVEFVRKNNLDGQMKLTRASQPTLCRFENRVIAGEHSNKEIISQFHPLVRFVSARIPETEAQIRPAISARVSRWELEPSTADGIYLIAVSLWSIRGLRNAEKLVYEGVHLDDPGRLLGEDEAERIALVCAAHGKRWLEAPRVCSLEEAHEIANNRLFAALDERFRRYVEEERARNEDRADIQERNLENHVSRQRETIQRTIRFLGDAGRTQLIPAHEGRLRALQRRYEDKKIEINSGRSVEERREDISVVLALVE